MPKTFNTAIGIYLNKPCADTKINKRQLRIIPREQRYYAQILKDRTSEKTRPNTSKTQHANKNSSTIDYLFQ